MKNDFYVSVLIVSGSDKGQYLLKNLLLEHHYGYQIKTCNSGSEARRELLNQSYDLVLINTPLQDEFGDKLAIHIKEQTNSEILIFMKNENYELTFDTIMKYAIFPVSKPISKDIALQAINLAKINTMKTKMFIEEKQKLEKKIEELKLVSKAKCALIEIKKMTEDEAHKYIEQEAMNQRCKRIEVALNILKRLQE